jgi:hypothetical protein
MYLAGDGRETDDFLLLGPEKRDYRNVGFGAKKPASDETRPIGSADGTWPAVLLPVFCAPANLSRSLRDSICMPY